MDSNANANVQEFIHVSDHVSPKLYVPIKVGNELIIVTQQDHRHIEDRRYVSYSKLLPNGTLVPFTMPNGVVGTPPYIAADMLGASGNASGTTEALNFSNAFSQGPFGVPHTSVAAALANIDNLVRNLRLHETSDGNAEEQEQGGEVEDIEDSD